MREAVLLPIKVVVPKSVQRSRVRRFLRKEIGKNKMLNPDRLYTPICIDLYPCEP